VPLNYESWVAGLVVGLWVTREIIPIVAKVVRNKKDTIPPPVIVTPAAIAPADGSGNYASVGMNEQLATRRELDSVKEDVAEIKTDMKAGFSGLNVSINGLTKEVSNLQGRLNGKR